MDASNTGAFIMATIQFIETGNSEIDNRTSVPVGDTWQLLHVSLKLSAAPTTSENLVITSKSVHGDVYDVVLKSQDLSATSVTDFVWFPDQTYYLVGGDELTITYQNTDVATYGLKVTCQQ